MIHFYKKVLKGKSFVIDFFFFFSLLKTWIPLSVLCRSHEQKYAQLHFKKCVYKPFYKKKKRKLETRDSGYRVFSSWKSV